MDSNISISKIKKRNVIHFYYMSLVIYYFVTNERKLEPFFLVYQAKQRKLILHDFLSVEKIKKLHRWKSSIN